MISQPTKSSRLACLILATVLAIPAFAAGPVSLQQLIQTSGSLIDGDKKFAGFAFSGDTNRISPANIFVETVALPGGLLGLKFTGAMSATGTSLDFGIFYTVETTSGLPLISEIGQSFVMTASGNGGFVLIGETVFDQGFFLGNVVAQSTIGFADVIDPVGEVIQGDQLIINPPQDKVWVTKDINLVPLDTNSSVGLSNLVQVYCQNQIVVTCPTNKTVGCNIPWTFDLPSATNACCSSNVTITVVSTVTNQISPCTFCATRTWRLSDACGNTTTNCAQTVCFIRDTTPPVITCTNLNLGCNPLTIPACSLTDVAVSDDCGPVGVTCTIVDTTNGCTHLRTVVYTAIDQCTNTATCTRQITWIQDTNPPVFTACPPDQDLGCNPLTIPGCNLGLVGVQDNCGPVGVTCSSVDTTNGCTRLRTITYTAIDICTNRAQCQQRITWKVDTTPPVLIGVPTNRNFQCFADYLALPPAVVTAFDNCDGTNVMMFVISSISGTCPTIIETCWTAIDQCSNSVRACVVYTIRDTIPPVIRCPTNNIIVGCDTNPPPCATSLAGFIAMGGFASDNCDTNLDYYCFDGPLIGNQIVRTHTVCDDCTNCASCTQIIAFVGTNRPPTLICPPNLTVECTNDVPPCLANVEEFLAAGGWVSTTNLFSFTCVNGPFIGSHCDGSITRTYTIRDRCSNTVSCQQRILVRDTTPPNIHCGPDKEVQCGTDWFFDIPTASDNCDGPNVPIVLVSTVTNIAVPRCPRIFSVTRTWRATDSCTNIAFCNQTVTIVDTEPPNITCEQDKEELCGIAWAFDIPTAVDKCDLNNVLIVVVSTVTNVSIPRCPAIFSVTRTWRATDTCGNASFCNQTVTIVDIEPPNITCEQDKEVQCGTDWAFDIPTAVDKCDLNNVLIEVVATVTNVANPRCPAIFSVTRTWRAVDTCGNSAFCNQTVTIVDLEPPNITCEQDKEVQCGTDWAFDIPTAVDKCDLKNVLIEVVATVTNTAVPRCPRIFSVTRTWRATDTCGNASFCNQTVTIVDTEPPNITCGPGKQAQCGTDWAFDIPTAVDNCDLNNVLIEVAVTVTNSATPRCPRLFSVIRIWRATDTCGNSSFCNQTVTIVDTQPPNLVCGPNKEAECGTDWFFDQPTAVDLCDSTNVQIEIVRTVTNYPELECPGIFSVTRTWKATDTCGNESFCNQTVTVVDTTPPNLICGPNKQAECGTDWDFDRPTALDLCDGDGCDIEVVGTETNYPQEECPGIFSVTRTWRATDICGNESFCNQTVTVVDTTPPHLICGPNKQAECGTDWDFDRPTAVDLCDGDACDIEVVRTETNLPHEECPGIFSVTRTWRATDICGNESFCNQTVTVVDTTPPNLICGPDKEVECGTDWNFDLPTAVDLCDGDACDIEVVRTETRLPTRSCPGILSVTRTWKATDICGNESFCNQTVTIVDTEPPNLACGPDKEVECGSDWAFDIPTAVDKCGAFALTLTPAQEPGGSGGTGSGSGIVTRSGSALTIDLTFLGLSSNSTAAHIHGPAGRGTNAAVLYPLTLIPPGTNAGAIHQMVMLVDGTGGFTIAQQVQQLESGLWYINIHTVSHPGGEIRGQLDTEAVIQVVSTVTNLPSRRCPGLLSVTRTWRATDPCGNSSFCNQTVTIVDTTPPNITCADDLIVECGNPFAFTRPTAYDACDGTNVVIEITSTTTNVPFQRCPGLFTVRRTWRAYDTCNNETFCSQTLTIVDTTPPNVTCAHDQIVECGNPFAFTRPTAYDVCDGTNVVIQITSTTTNVPFERCPGLFTVRRTWRAYDTCTNETFCSQTITIVDTTPPNLTCADDQIVECGNPFAFTRPTAYDACDGTNVVIQITSTTTNVPFERCPGLFTVRRTWRAIDTCTNETFCSQTITIVDTTPPNLTCAHDQIVECGNPFAFTRPTAYDACDGTNVVIQITSTTTNVPFERCPGLFTVRRTWRAIDTCTNETFCSQTITIVDTTPPNLTCADDQIVECGHPFAFTRPTAYDACDGTNVVIQITSTTTNVPFERCPGLFTVRRTWRAIDTCTNETFCSQTITIVDTTPPNLTCADDQIVECGHPFAFTRPTAYDACDGTNVVIQITSTTTNATVPRCPGLFTVRRTWRAIDTCTNETFCSQTITIVDTTPPNLTCAHDQIVECGNPFAFTRPTAYDACDGTNVVIEITSTTTNATIPRCPGLFTVRRTWRAIDTCTNETFCSQTITIVDTTPPNITCADDQIVECNQPFAFTRPTAVDACDGTNVVIEITSTTTNAAIPRCPNLFTVRRTWRAIDTCTNETFCSQTITIVDTTPPNLTCAHDRFVECGMTWTFTPPSAVDGCDGTNVTIVIASTVTNATIPRCPNLFSATRTWRATDTCGNAALCSQTVEIVDTTAPELVCANDRVVQCGLPWNFTPPFAVDICDGTNVTIAVVNTVTNGQCGRTFSATRTWRASDTCGNSVLCSQSILVVDTVPPEITCAPSRVLECGTPWNFTPPAANDVCDGTNVVVAIVSTTTNLVCGRTINATRIWSATDLCGNRSLCSQTITVVDTVPPVITCPADRMVECGTPWNFGTPNVTDVCDGTNVTVQVVSTLTNALCGRTYTATRTWRATDQCGNSSSCSQTITVVDTTPPTLACNQNQTVECGTPFAFNPPAANDMCDGTNVTVTIVGTVTNATCGNTFTATRTWKATDACTNMSFCSQTINVVDTTPPSLGCSPNRMVECGTPFTFTPPAAFDSCHGTNVTITIVSTTTNATCGATFVAVRTWQATDPCGNRAQCSQTIRVVDSEPPVLAGIPGNQFYFCFGDVPPPPPVTAFDFCDTNVTVTYSAMTNGRCPFMITRCWTAVDDCGNSVQECQSISVSPPPPVVIGPTNQTTCPGDPASFCAVISSACPTAQQWYRDGVAISGATNACYTIPSVATTDAGEYCITVTTPCHSITNCARLEVCMSALGDRVWNDYNHNGVQDGGEPGVQDVMVQLYDCLDNPLQAKPTDEFGNYLFTGLTAGTYRVAFALPASYKFTIPDVGNDALDSDADTITGRTGCYTLGVNETNLTVDAGIFKPAALGDFVWLDLNTNGVQDGGLEVGVPNVTVRLMNCTNGVLATTNTDANGYYLFDDLLPGSYKVTFVLPPNYHFTLPNVGADDMDSDANPITGMTGCYTLLAGEINLTVDAGLYVLTPCPPATFNLTGNTATSGALGNTRTFSAGGVSVKASAFSRTTGGAWATAYLGSYASGLGVTDNSEGDGSNDRHTVDNVGQVNYVLFEFSQPIVVNRAYLDYVITDSDITVWIGNFNDPFNNHLTLSDALLASFALTEDNLASGAGARWAMFNGSQVSGNTLVIAAKPGGSLDDQFKISKLDICTPPEPCAPALRLTTACVSASALGQPITFSGTVSNAGNVTLNNITVTHSIAGVVNNIATLAPGATADYAGSFTPESCGSFGATITASGRAACRASNVTATASSICSVPCPPDCPPATFNLSGNSASSGTFGNTRTFSAGGVSVRASGFSRTTNGTWATAYLGSYSHGLGVTDSSEGDGSNDRHVVDNVGRFNYVLFEFSQPVVVNRAYLDYVITDSDITVWIGTFPNPYNNHLTLSDALLASFAVTEDNLASGAGSRWAVFNGSEVSGNTLVIAAKPGGTLNDQFKLSKLDICTPPVSCAPALQLTTACVSAGALGQPITFSGTVSNAGNTVISNVTVTHSLVGVVRTIASLAAGTAANYSGSFTPTNCGAFAASITATGKAVCNGRDVAATAYSTCTVPCAPACPPSTFKLTGSSPSSGTLGNTRTFSAGGMSVRASAFSRTTGGAWEKAYLGSYSHGLGVTDSSEGDGSNNRHVVDNVGRFNYVLFEFNQLVVVNRAYLDYVITDSDIKVWIGTFPDPYNNHLVLSDALLASFALTEDNPSSGPGARWAMFNGSEVPGNALVIAAKPGGSSDDQFKITKLDVCTPPGTCPIFIRPSGDRCLVEWSPSIPSSRCVLESTTSLRPPVNWSVVAVNPPNPYAISNAPQNGVKFYRMRIQ